MTLLQSIVEPHQDSTLQSMANLGFCAEKSRIIRLFAVILAVTLVHLLVMAVFMVYSSRTPEIKKPSPIMVRLVSGHSTPASQPLASSPAKPAPAQPQALPKPQSQTATTRPETVPARPSPVPAAKPLVQAAPAAPRPEARPVAPVPAVSPATGRPAAPDVQVLASQPVDARAGSSTSRAPTTDASARTDSKAESKAVGSAPVNLGESGIEYLKRPESVYPAVAYENGDEGTTRVLVEVDESGKPTHVSVKTSSGSSALDQAALKAARGARFKPLVRDGVARRAIVIVPIEFSLRNS